jgi:Na+/H+ antiporter NhaD/arsenite permease-like protein
MTDPRSTSESQSEIVSLSPAKFLAGCSVASAVIFFAGTARPLPVWSAAVEVLATILALFVLGSIKYRLDKNALTYGAALVVAATVWGIWWPGSALKAALAAGRSGALGSFFRSHFLTLRGLDGLVHMDTMLFILGLTFFVGCVAQTRLLETVSFAMLNRFKGRVVPTILALTFLVSFLSGILDGVSMIGLLIRTLVIILVLAGAARASVLYSVMVSTIVTTVCGMWLAYGEPPNLIMKANLHPLLNDAFFLRYCLPAAVGSWIVVGWNVARRLKGGTVALGKLDILDRHVADVRFLQAARHGEVLIPLEFAQCHRGELGGFFNETAEQLGRGVPLGEALVRAGAPREKRLALLGEFVDEGLAVILDDYYAHGPAGNDRRAEESAIALGLAMKEPRKGRLVAQRTAVAAFIPFIGLLAAHALNHEVPLFLASFAGFAVAFLSVRHHPKMRKLALREAAHEYEEYLFLFPLFFSITLLQKTGFFSLAAQGLRLGVERLGADAMALAQFGFCTILSALLDNNVVADFSARALRGLGTSLIHLFAMAQIAGYALGGCWTHIGSAQSVVAYAFIRKEVDGRFTPFAWIRAMTGVILEIAAVVAAIVVVEGWIIRR